MPITEWRKKWTIQPRTDGDTKIADSSIEYCNKRNSEIELVGGPPCRLRLAGTWKHSNTLREYWSSDQFRECLTYCRRQPTAISTLHEVIGSCKLSHGRLQQCQLLMNPRKLDTSKLRLYKNLYYYCGFDNKKPQLGILIWEEEAAWAKTSSWDAIWYPYSTMRNQLDHHHSCCSSKAARPHGIRDHLEEKQQLRPSCLVDQTHNVIWILSLDNCVQFMCCLIKLHLLLLALVDFFSWTDTSRSCSPLAATAATSQLSPLLRWPTYVHRCMYIVCT